MRKHRVILKCLDLAIEYELNNVLHSVVLQSITSMCEEFDLATTVDDYSALFDAASSGDEKNLVDTILNAYENSDRLKAARGYQCCYMGHLHIMANAVHDASIKAAQIMEANPGSMELFQKKQTGGVPGEEKAMEAAVSSLKPPPPSSGDEEAAAAQLRRSSTNSTTRAAPASEYSASTLEVAAMIVTACASNARWRDFVDARLPEINKRRKCGLDFGGHVFGGFGWRECCLCQFWWSTLDADMFHLFFLSAPPIQIPNPLQSARRRLAAKMPNVHLLWHHHVSRAFNSLMFWKIPIQIELRV
jgi:hypothetical protein